MSTEWFLTVDHYSDGNGAEHNIMVNFKIVDEQVIIDGRVVMPEYAYRYSTSDVIKYGDKVIKYLQMHGYSGPKWKQLIDYNQPQYTPSYFMQLMSNYITIDELEALVAQMKGNMITALSLTGDVVVIKSPSIGDGLLINFKKDNQYALQFLNEQGTYSFINFGVTNEGKAFISEIVAESPLTITCSEDFIITQGNSIINDVMMAGNYTNLQWVKLGSTIDVD